ncbi:2-carboxy-1,4-naphthoquinone phytyltransferase [Stenomitos frigidus]|uniref:2-carboxy-1,4-naphthoquinone phytyltransferase n=1 Tax=Stenomitos frigidus ULC18 TaxID=2107698 RepID=A0A2T1DZJ0_9CYAN|nr:2-carboxy-1,4-naphthoquinone phytyltransferase [Stenomitos frigidus]PSB25918.1 2-carboxy-1,4-naphthoquinone phytyltransferase [Stenomitos frigidus ULC18]
MTTKAAGASANVLAKTPGTQKKLWLAAIKPPMYSVAIMPIVVGTAIAVAETKTLQTGIFAIFVFAAILILAWENLANDVFDSETGVDIHKSHSLVHLTHNKSLIFWLGNLCLATGLFGIGAIAAMQKDLTVVGIILLCCILGYIYQGPPFRLSYQGWGEILCFFAFGPLAFAAAYYSQTQAWSGTNFAASTIVGMSTSLILFCSHFHQEADDAAVGKRSPIVRLGTQRAAQLLPWLTGSIFALTAVCVWLGVFPVTTLLVFASLPIAFKLCKHVGATHNKPEKVSNCKFIAVAMHFWSGIFLGLGFVLPQLLGLGTVLPA